MPKQLDKGSVFLSNLVHYRTYAATKKDGFKEDKFEMFSRVEKMHLQKYPHIEDEIHSAFDYVYGGLTLPSMRTCQFAGEPIFKENTRLYNCAFTAIKSFQSFAETLFLLCCGTGVGFSVQQCHVSQFPVIQAGYDSYHKISDSKEGWADSLLKILFNPKIEFDYSLIRPEGALLSSGGLASGPLPLKKCHEKMRIILFNARNRRLSSVECADIVCHIADCVVVGSSRRSATISIFDWFDNEMLAYKSGNWWEQNGQRARANVSASIYRKDKNAKKAFNKVLDFCFENHTGEPGIFWTSDPTGNTCLNPCAEASLRDNEFCNLTSTNVAGCKDIAEYLKAVEAATIIGTLQAGYDKFGYLNPQWYKNVNESRLLGVSMTGIAEAWDILSPEVLAEGANIINTTNERIAKKIGINTAARKGCIKPEGTGSASLGVSSGITAHIDEYYWRRVRIDKNQVIAQYLLKMLPAAFIEQDVMNPLNLVVNIPIAKPGSLTSKKESAIELLEREKRLYQYWILPSHSSGINTHNVSITVYYKPEEKQEIKEWMWLNKDYYSGIALFPDSDTTYAQLPFESMSESNYNEIITQLPEVNLADVNYLNINEERKHEISCGGGSCEMTSL